MKRILILFLFVALPSFILGQSNYVISMLFKAKVNRCIYPATEKVYGPGIGLEVNERFNNNFQSFLTLNLDLFPQNDVRTIINGKELPNKKSIVSIFIGISYHPIEKIWISFEGGPSFIPSQTYFSIKPAIGYYFDKKKKYGIDLSLTNIFKLDVVNEGSYGYLSLGFNVRIF